MNFEILKQTKNPFLNREELKIEIKAESTPSFEELKTALDKDKELTIIKRIDSNFGTKIFHADVLVYDNKESKDRVEPKIKKKKGEEQSTPTTPAQPTPTENKPEQPKPEQAKEEKPAEENKPEIKQEKKENAS